MRTSTQAEDYRSAEVFALEQEHLFRAEWQFAGFARDLATEGDYIVAQSGGKSVVVQNFNGELKAFLNVCSHRFSAIRKDCKGRGPLQCQYHGWVYDAAGLPVGIANVKEFDDITEERRHELALQKWDVQRCGELVFVREGERGGQHLMEFLGGCGAVVEGIGNALGEQIDCNRMMVDSNWKVAVENTLESYHVRSVHPDTFARLAAQTREFTFDDPHSGWHASIDAGMQKKLNRLTRMLGVQSSYDSYFHQLVFPSLTLATTAGMTYAVQTFRPVDEGLTEFTSYVFAARHDGTDAQRQLLMEASKPAAEFNRAVFDEDRAICGETQKGIAQAPAEAAGELSREERRVADFQRAWKVRMDAAIRA